MEANPYIQAFDKVIRQCEQFRKGLITEDEFEENTMEALLELGNNRFEDGRAS